jgi:hypothetical protein
VLLSASKKLIIDSDLILTNTHLILMAPVIDITKETMFQFDGESGESHPDNRAPGPVSSGENGKDGLDGNPGYSSGSLTVFALEFINARNLTVKLIGGNGGEGQDGRDGKNGNLGEKTVTESETIPNRVNPWFAAIPGVGAIAATVAWMSKNEVKKKNRIEASRNDSATDGGKGGNGGVAACPGEVENFIGRESETADVYLTTTTNGTSGKAGRGGKGGENPSLPGSNISASARNGADGIEPTAVAVTANYKYKLDQTVVKSQINHFISLAEKGGGSKVSDETKTFVDYLSTF